MEWGNQMALRWKWFQIGGFRRRKQKHRVFCGGARKLRALFGILAACCEQNPRQAPVGMGLVFRGTREGASSIPTGAESIRIYPLDEPLSVMPELPCKPKLGENGACPSWENVFFFSPTTVEHVCLQTAWRCLMSLGTSQMRLSQIALPHHRTI